MAVTVVTDNGALPVLVSVTDCGALVVPTAWPGKVRLVGFGLATGAGALFAVPFKATTPGVSPALLWNSRAAMWSPSALGVNDTVAVQLAPMASVVRQVLVAIV